MKFLNWRPFIFKSSFTFRTRDCEIDLEKNSYRDMSAGFTYKRSSLHSTAPFKQHMNFGLIKSPLNPLNPRHSPYFYSWKNGIRQGVKTI